MKAIPEYPGLPAPLPETDEAVIDPRETGETESITRDPAPVDPEFLKWLDELL
jgi:hypothetical protein